MNSTIMIQKAIKDEALKKAKSEGFSLSTIVKILLQDYVKGKIGIGSLFNDDVRVDKVERIEVDEETQDMMDSVVKKWRYKFSN